MTDRNTVGMTHLKANIEVSQPKVSFVGMSANISVTCCYCLISLFAVSAGLDLDKVANWTLQSVLLFLLATPSRAWLLLNIARNLKMKILSS